MFVERLSEWDPACVKTKAEVEQLLARSCLNSGHQMPRSACPFGAQQRSHGVNAALFTPPALNLSGL
jgi:hypothetical protein